MDISSEQFWSGAIFALSVICGLLIIAWPFRRNRKQKTDITKAAISLQSEVVKARDMLQIYFDKISKIEEKYKNGDIDLSRQLPMLKLHLDDVQLSQKYLTDCAKIEKRGQSFILPYNKRYLYERVARYAVMFYFMIGLLKTSKVSGFMRSTKMLEEYITQRHNSSVKKVITDAFAEDYFDENAYNIYVNLSSERSIFIEPDGKDVTFKDLITDLESVVRHSQALF
ncbi:hypothetical protein OVA03_10770 [Asticcacaulis sp. SL142]|uniref:hypothetical protein n=1 Tax=Asticcacaulis sp. SL142 TaxID=2995155 RepID=UPI00226CF121|nr:hypothetical protein [Asticcacaulis sp. SL142]WAC47189.1 hypothetical protein OVA03_10770 [Asticcacaulis sp. SL142]